MLCGCPQLLGNLVDEFDDLQAFPDRAGGTSLEMGTQILDEILRPLLAPQKVRLFAIFARTVLSLLIAVLSVRICDQDENQSAYELTKQLLCRCERKLNPYVKVTARWLC
jgi:hypothetical protein